MLLKNKKMGIMSLQEGSGEVSLRVDVGQHCEKTWSRSR